VDQCFTIRDELSIATVIN